MKRKLCLLFTALIFTALMMQQLPVHAANLVLVLDPGHGGTDPGATSTVDGVLYREATLNLKIAQAAEKYLKQYKGVDVYMTRNTADATLTLAQRVSYANRQGAHALVSIHINSAGDSSAGGTLVLTAGSTYRKDITEATEKLGNAILNKVCALGLRNRGTVTMLATSGSYVVFYPDGSPQDYYGIVQRSVRAGFPGIIIESAFLSNPDDVRQYLSSDEKLDRLGKAIAEGIASYYGLSTDSPYQTTARTPIDGSHLDFSLSAHRALAYPLGGSKRKEETDALTIESSNSAPTVLFDYMGMALNAKDYGCAVITAKASYNGASLSVYCGCDEVVTINENYCMTQTLTTEYRSYLLDFSKLPAWDMAVNLLQLNVRGAESLSIKSIQFYANPSQVPDSDAVVAFVPGGGQTPTPDKTPTAAPTEAPTPTPAPTATPTPTAEPTQTPDNSEESAPAPSSGTPTASPSAESHTADPDSMTPAAGENGTKKPADPNDGSTGADSDIWVIILIVLAAAAIAAIAVFISVNIQKRKR